MPPTAWPTQIHHYAHDFLEAVIAHVRSARALFHSCEADWNTDVGLEALSGSPWLASESKDDGGVHALVELDPGVIRLDLRSGQLHAEAYGASDDAARAVLERCRENMPVSEGLSADAVSVNFWSYEPSLGRASSLRRDITVTTWSEIEVNYTARTRSALARLMQRPPDAAMGKLILWHGEPGTGKTWALRALAREWHSWADAHYVIDPEQFFGQSPTYMLRVITSEGDARAHEWEDDVRPRRGDRWKLLIVEDAGELLGMDAKLQAGQALARLLNTCDGMVGQGLRLLVLITTNEEVGKLHPAVIRRGRCLANIEFGRLTDAEVLSWAAVHGVDHASVHGGRLLSDLFNAELIEAGANRGLPGFRLT